MEQEEASGYLEKVVQETVRKVPKVPVQREADHFYGNSEDLYADELNYLREMDTSN